VKELAGLYWFSIVNFHGKAAFKVVLSNNTELIVLPGIISLPSWISSEELMSYLFKYVKDTAEKYTGKSVDCAVATVSVHFIDAQGLLLLIYLNLIFRENLRSSLSRIQLYPMRLIAHPVAAIFA
jgi:molecular chaperone DnaK (HSP70)